MAQIQKFHQNLKNFKILASTCDNKLQIRWSTVVKNDRATVNMEYFDLFDHDFTPRYRFLETLRNRHVNGTVAHATIY